MFWRSKSEVRSRERCLEGWEGPMQRPSWRSWAVICGMSPCICWEAFLRAGARSNSWSKESVISTSRGSTAYTAIVDLPFLLTLRDRVGTEHLRELSVFYLWGLTGSCLGCAVFLLFISFNLTSLKGISAWLEDICFINLYL